MKYAFEEYIPRKGGHQTEQPTVTISKFGRISFNTPATELLKGCGYIALYYDTENRVIGVKPLEKKTGNAYKLANQPGSKAKFATTRGFLNNFGLTPEESKTYIVEWDETLGMIIIKLGGQQ